MIKKILIANRGEVALRVLRTCKQMGIHTVAVYAKPDQNLMHVRLADEAICIGPAEPKQSYLNTAAIISAAHLTNAQAIHPGYGFLSEQADFAEAVESCGLKFIGPTPETIRLMSDKVSALATAKRLGLPTLPGSEGAISDDFDTTQKIADALGYPLVIKAVGGGGGRGMRIVRSADRLEPLLALTRREAELSFGDSRVYLERFLDAPRHVEVQVIGDGVGHAIHLGDRDCSIQRKHQKIIEEAPAPRLPESQRTWLHQVCVSAAKKLKYRGVGTFEFLYDRSHFYFIEMNTRLQVEHPVTELVTGIDLVEQQIQVAAGEGLHISQDQVKCAGHAIECRINAEHPTQFTPCPGQITHYHPPGGPGVRMDTHIYSGYVVPPFYDSLLGKLVCHGRSRHVALTRMRAALDEIVIQGIDTNLSFLRNKVLTHPGFTSTEGINKHLSIHLLEKHICP